jgi:hypothetical protein
LDRPHQLAVFAPRIEFRAIDPVPAERGDVLRVVDDQIGNPTWAGHARRIGAELGWVPASDIAAGLRRTIAWYMARWITAQHCRLPAATDEHPGDGADLPPQYLPGHAIQKRA